MTNSLFVGVIGLKAIPEVIHAFPWTFQGESDEYKKDYFLSGYGSSAFYSPETYCP